MESALSMRLRELRSRERQVTQSELAVLLGVSASLVSTWESGRTVPPENRLIQYAELFQPARGGQLLEELMALRALVAPAEPVPVLDHQASSLVVLQDIRWLLRQILDRLPPSS